jgi:hypothetical protein
MTLLDHFHPPLSLRRHWHAFHNAWATYIAADLNRRLPKGYFAEPNVQFGFEIDVATFEEPPAVLEPPESYEVTSSPTEADLEWTPPRPVQIAPFQFVTDIVEVLVFGGDAGPVLVGAVELVSPANKDRAAHREAFVSKCETYLRQGVALVMVDVVTNRQANLHQDLLVRLDVPDEPSPQANLYAAAYRPFRKQRQSCLAIWREPLAIGRPLPAMPLWLGEMLCVPLDLEATYTRTCREQRSDISET